MARPAPLADVTEEIEYTEREDVGRMPFGMVGATAALVGASLMVTVLAGPIAGITDRAAESAQDVEIYRTAVLGDTADDPTRNLEPRRLDDGSDAREFREHDLPTPPPVNETAVQEPTPVAEEDEQ